MLVIGVLLIILIGLEIHTMATVSDVKTQLDGLKTTAQSAIDLLAKLSANQPNPADIQAISDGITSVNNSLSEAVTLAQASLPPSTPAPAPAPSTDAPQP